jgi:dipeptidyl aminopeptidase/acylaminoacyl peptidase
MRNARVWAFVALCAAAALLAGGYATSAIRSRAPVDAGSGTGAAALAAPPAKPYLMFRSTAPGPTWKKLLLVPVAAAEGAAYATNLQCERAYFAGNRGVCLVEEYSGLTAKRYADIFDAEFRPLHRIPLTGLPSRTRLTADGRRAAVTVFEQGHSYASEGFSTRTSMIDTIAGRVLSDLEQFTVIRDGQRFSATDFNFWGVTFAQDGNRFFATLASGGVHYLVEGNVDRREALVVRTGVECPSLSPDNTRIAFKHATSTGHWQLRVYDLRTKNETTLTTETRSVDDQVEWLDDDHVMYHITGSRGADLWALRSDGTGPPTLVREYAYSPAVVR